MSGPAWSNVVLALHFDGTDGSTDYVDEKGHTVTLPDMGASISTADHAPLAGNTACSRHESDYPSTVTIPADTAFNSFGLADFALEFWIKSPSGSGSKITVRCVSLPTLSPVAWRLYFTASTVLFIAAASNVYIAPVPYPEGQWTHISVCRINGVTTLRINGVTAGVDLHTAYPIDVPNAPFEIKVTTISTGAIWRIDDLIMSVGEAYRTADFTPPTAPFSGDVFIDPLASPAIGVGGKSGQWSPIIRIGGVDVSDSIIGDIRIDAEESAARIAELTLRPPAGSSVNLAAYTGRSVEIDIADASTDTLGEPNRLFTGIIDTPSLDQSARLISLRCTDDLQGKLFSMPSSEIDLFVGGYWSSAIFDAAAKGWTRAQDRVSTIASALDASPLGVLRMTAWAAKETPDLILTETLIGENSLSPQLADAGGLTNQVLIDFGYRFPRVKAEMHVVNFFPVDMTGFAQYLLDGKVFLQRAQVEAAIEASGGTLEEMAWAALPDEIIAVGEGYFTPGPYDADLCMGFTARVSFDYTQTIEEQFAITVGNAASIAAVGLRQTTLSGAMEGAYPDLTAVETNLRMYSAGISTLPPSDVSARIDYNTASADVTLSTATNRAAANLAMETLIAIAKTRIYAAHRRNRISASVPLLPSLDLDKTIQIDADGIQATGKCVRVSHRLSADSGAATSEFSLAISALSGVGITHPEDPTSAPAGTTAAAVQIGASAICIFHNAAAEDHKFSITFPAVTSAQRNNVIVPITSSIAAPIEENEFVVSL